MRFLHHYQAPIMKIELALLLALLAGLIAGLLSILFGRLLIACTEYFDSNKKLMDNIND